MQLNIRFRVEKNPWMLEIHGLVYTSRIDFWILSALSVIFLSV